MPGMPPANRRAYDLTQFTLRNITQCSAALRTIGAGALSFEAVARRVVRYFYEHLGSAQASDPACVLVRFFKTQPFGSLDEESQRYVVALLGRHPDTPLMKCFTLMASAGLQPEWNDPKHSTRYKAIPITGDRFSTQFPMFFQLLTQFGVSVDALLPSGHELLVDEHEKSYNVFFVPRAAGSPYVPVQEEFVSRYGVQSVLGFGGLLPSGDLFAVILFTKVEISKEIAELFRTLTLAVKLAVLPFDGGPSVRARRRGPDAVGRAMNANGAAGELEKLQSRVTALEQLLDLHETLVIQQAERLESALHQLKVQTDVLSAVVAGTDPSVQEEFFHSLVYHLAVAANVRYALVGELLPGRRKRIRTLAVWAQNRFVDNFEYDLEGTPCAQVLHERASYFPSGIRRQFPAFTFPAAKNVDAYCGVRLTNAAGQPLGVLALLHDDPIDSSFDLKHIVRLFAVRAGAELARRRAEERTQVILKAALDGFCELDREGNIVEASETYCRLSGYSRDELLSMNLRELEDLGTPAEVTGLIERIIRCGGDRFETRYRRKDGSLRDVDVSVRYTDQDGGRFFCFLRDITERKRAEEALRLRDRAISATTNGIVITDPREDGNPILYVNPAFERMTGYAASEVTGRNFEFLYGPGTDPAAVTEIRQALWEVRNLRTVLLNYRKDGTAFWNELTLSPILDAHGRLTHCVGVLTDVTERKRLEAALRESVERLDLAVRGSQDGLWDGHKLPDIPWYDSQTPVWWSPRIREMLGYAEHEFPNILGSWTPLLHPEDRDRVFAALFAHIERRVPYDVEYRLRTKAGVYRWFRAKGQAIWDDSGNVLRMSGSLSDISDRKEAEEELRVTNAMLTALVRSSPMAIVIIDLQGRVKLWNLAAERIFGWREEEAIGRPLPLVPPDKREEHLALRERVLRDESFAGLEVVRQKKNGALIHAELSTALLRDDKDRPCAILGLLADITERKRAEEKLLQRERDLRKALEERERISQDLHDGILQSLYAVGLGLESCKPLLSGGARKAIMSLDQAIAQLNGVMREIRSFIVGLQAEAATSHDLAAALRAMVQALAQPHPTRFRVYIDPAVTDTVTEDRRLHLLHVAKEAVSNCLRHARADRGSVSLRVLKDCVRLTVRDNGVGFDPRKARGAGNGFANMAARAQRVGGKFAVLSKPRQGTRVVFELPKDGVNARA